MENLKEKKIVLFDGVCNLCEGLVQFLIEKNKTETLFFASLQGNFAQEILKKNHLETQDFKTFVFIENGIIYQKSDAALAVCKQLSAPWKYFVVFKIFPSFLMDFFYDLIAKNRFILFGKKTKCWLPTKALKVRFLD